MIIFVVLFTLWEFLEDSAWTKSSTSASWAPDFPRRFRARNFCPLDLELTADVPLAVDWFARTIVDTFDAAYVSHYR